MQRVLGIDLGTTNSVMAWMRRGQPEIVPNKNRDSTPSVLGLGKNGELLVGDKAGARERVDPANVVRSVKRFMGRQFADPEVARAAERMATAVAAGPDGDVAITFAGRSYSPTELSSMILRRLKEEAEDSAGVEFPRAVITVPAYFTERQILATRQAGRQAGFQVLKVLDEPTAAALAYAYQREEPEDATLLVFDLGGGTFDISVLLVVEGVFTILDIEGDNFLGGDDFDALLAERAAAEFRALGSRLGAADRVTVRSEAERAKIDLSTDPDAELNLANLGTPPETVDLEIDRADFVELIRPRVDRALELVVEAMRVADVDPAGIDQVLLVGGSTAVPYVRERLAEVFGADRLRTGVHPMKSVALGAAVHGTHIAEVRCEHCDAASPVAAEECVACGRSLRPPVKITCPMCFLAADAGVASCPKCSFPLGGAVTGGPDRMAPEPAAPATTTLSVDVPAEPDGQQCRACGTVNVQGATTCATCGHALVEPVLEITPQDRGIELHDGTMSVVMPKGTPYPTSAQELVSRDYVTAVADQRRLEIVVYEGGSEIAGRNALTGYLTIALPPGLPRGAPINVAFGLDASKTLTVEVRVRALGDDPHRVTIQHERMLGPDDLRRVEEQRLKTTDFVDRWSGELSPAEAGVFYDLIGEMDATMADGRVTRAQAEETNRRADRLVETVAEIRGFDAFLSALLVGAGKYLDPDDRDEILRFSTEIDEARDRADWGAASVVVGQGRELTGGFPREIHDLVYCRTFSRQGSVSAGLGHRIETALTAYDDAHDKGDRAGKRGAAAHLAELWDEVQAELKTNRDGPVAVTKPRQAGR
ncbi:Hsp70 family protein [Actinomycetospora sp. CA-101289]|uniref:Hsp70 family protein n=1 Tax=Actinomycetospora sp. CA-101289 TaxID=3239893 RepID=UPI003D97D5AF